MRELPHFDAFLWPKLWHSHHSFLPDIFSISSQWHSLFGMEQGNWPHSTEAPPPILDQNGGVHELCAPLEYALPNITQYVLEKLGDRCAMVNPPSPSIIPSILFF